MGTDITSDTMKLIDYSVDFAKKMLTDFEEFNIFSVTINLNGDRLPASYFDGDVNLTGQDIINKLEALHDQQLLNKERRACALTYLVKVKKDNSSYTTDTIAVKIKHTDTKDVTIYYFAYRLTSQKTIEQLDSWRVQIMGQNALNANMGLVSCWSASWY